MKAIDRAVKAAGGRLKLARKLGITYQAVQKWELGKVPAERVLAVEALTRVSRHDLRPDIYPRERRRPEARA